MTKPDQPWWFVSRTGWGYTIEANQKDAEWLLDFLTRKHGHLDDREKALKLADKLKEAIEGVA